MSVTPSHPVVVLASFPKPRPTTNPYITMLADSLAANGELQLETFSWRRALFGSYDVFHAHWPENLVRGASTSKSLVRTVLFGLFLLRMRIRSTAIVRTMHNVAPHERPSTLQRWLLRALDRMTAHRISLNGDQGKTLADRPVTTILHGHYIDWFKAYPRSPQRPGSLGFVGLIRPYKNVPALIDAFREVEGPDLTLSVVGSPNSEELRDRLVHAGSRDPRVKLDLRYVDDRQLTWEVTGTQAVVLPYEEMHNSGVALMALSMGRPIIVPDTEATRRLADEVGEGWVLRYSGPLTAEQLANAVRELGRGSRGRAPDLSRRSWEAAGDQHLEVYRAALGRSRPAQSLKAWQRTGRS